MFEISRRDLVLGSTGAALVFGLKGPVSFIGAAQAQRAADSLKYKVGDIEVFSLHDGSVERAVADGFVKNASLDDVKKALTAGGIGPDKFDNPFTVTAIRTGGKVILFDTGFRRQRPADRRQARRQHEGGRPRSRGRLHRRDLAFPSRSHLGPVGEGDQRAGVSERGNHDARGRVQVLDRSGAGGEATGRRRAVCPAHSVDLPDLEEHQAVRRRRRPRAWRPRDCDARPYRRPHVVPGGVGRTATLHPERRHRHPPAVRQRIPAGSRCSMPTGRRPRPRDAPSSIA